jgi:hypothetical protein
VVLQLAEAPGEGHVLGTADVLVAQEQHPMLEQQARNSANSPSSRIASARLTPISSAPMAQVSCSTCMQRPSSDDEDRRAGGLARFQVAVGLNGILQGVVLVDLDADAAAADVANSSPARAAFPPGRRCNRPGPRVSCSEPFMASNCGSNGGMGRRPCRRRPSGRGA